MKFLTEKQLNILRGKALAGPLMGNETKRLFDHIDALENLLDTEVDPNDGVGTEGWRHFAGIDD